MVKVCIATPIPTERKDVTKLFSANELQLAKNAGVPDHSLIEGKLIEGTYNR